MLVPSPAIYFKTIFQYLPDAVKSLRLVELRVPTHEPEGGMALLGCQYDLEGDTLYSVKWYKDGREFYRFVPKNDPPVYYFQAPGVNVEVSIMYKVGTIINYRPFLRTIKILFGLLL